MTNNLTLAKVNRAIRHTGLRARRCSSGYYYWDSVTKEAEQWVGCTPSVYVFSVRQLTLSQWIKEAETAAKFARKS